MLDVALCQPLIGGDKKNPAITVARYPHIEPPQLYVYWGSAELEVVSDDKDNIHYKMLIGRLFNAGLNRDSLHDAFGIAISTMQRWGNALKSPDPEHMIRAFSGQGAPLKYIIEIQTFVEKRFPKVYSQNRKCYSSVLREEIKNKFDTDLCAETIRLHLKILKAQFHNKQDSVPIEQSAHSQTALVDTFKANTCDITEIDSHDVEPHNSSSINNIQTVNHQSDLQSNRKYSLFFEQEMVQFNHHAGLLLFASMLKDLHDFIQTPQMIFKQWTASVLLNAVNIEQTKFLHFNNLEKILGKQIQNLSSQRAILNYSSLKEEHLATLFKFNADMIQAQECSDFYLDPHTKHYTGAQKILKGWCPQAHSLAKALHMDFIHTVEGKPVFIGHEDNFDDLRRRFPRICSKLRDIISVDKKKKLTFIVDRAIFKHELFLQSRKQNNYLITWEKGYTKGLFGSELFINSCHLLRPRNCLDNLEKYTFQYFEQFWHKDQTIRQIIVNATNPKGNSVEVSILATDLERNAAEIIKLIFKRWIQENDFKYLIAHFGIDQITSYNVLDYKNLVGIIEDRQAKTGKLKALEIEKEKLTEKIGKPLAKKHLGKTLPKKIQEGVKELTKKIKNIEKEIKLCDKESSRLQDLISNKCKKLDTRSKAVMDIVKIISRNMFYELLSPFREIYNNLRDDHKILRNLTHASGFIRFDTDPIEITLMPTMQHQKKIRKDIEVFLAVINEKNPRMPDGTGRKIVLKLFSNQSELFAIKKAK